VTHLPYGEADDLVCHWLWSGQQSVFSHESGLFLHQLSDILPARAYMTLPLAWKKRRLRPPKGVTVHYADVRDAERTWVGAVPVTKPARTLRDCADVSVPPDFVAQAIDEGLDRGLFRKEDIPEAFTYLERFGYDRNNFKYELSM
jgi:predicted transcriptional regulator of viral defense system